MKSLVDLLNTSEDLQIPIPGTRLPEGPKLTDLQRRCCELCGWTRDSFPGSQPVSMSKSDLSLLSSQDFLVAEKTDGIRYLLYIHQNEQFLIDRNFHFNKLSMFFTSTPFPDTQPLEETLFDGELVRDKIDKNDPDKGYVLRFMVFDTIAFHRKPIIQRNLIERLSKAADMAGLRESHRKGGRSFEGEPFEIYPKQMFATKHTAHILTDVIPNLTHGNDGLIFTPVRDPYVPGTFSKLLKWKFSYQTTVDFKIAKDCRGDETMFQLYVMDRLMLTFYCYVDLPREQHDVLAHDYSVSNYVVECLYDPTHRTYIPPPLSKSPDTFMGGQFIQGGWKLERVRTDREKPNDIRVVKKIMKAMEEAVTLKELMEFTARIPKDIDKNMTGVAASQKVSVDQSRDVFYKFEFVKTPPPVASNTELEPEMWSQGVLPIPPGLHSGIDAGNKRRAPSN
ncbi:hypothetical protein GEMRC1_006671 [Eukaryota sp. GEM-RC1]